MQRKFGYKFFQACIAMAICLCFGLLAFKLIPAGTVKPYELKRFNFDPAQFKNPSSQFGPYTRWWWPGNDVTKEELTREINLFADNHFGGVEIQPFALVFPAKGGKEQQDRITGYDSPEYYDNLKAVLNEANKRGLTVDLTDGSGWPAGGPHLTEEDNNLTLEFGVLNVTGGKNIEVIIPRAIRGDRPSARLQVVMAAKIIKDNSDKKGSVYLDPQTAMDITSQVKDNKLTWDCPEGSWKLIAFWGIPDGEQPSIIAKKDAGYVMNHWDSTKVLKNYNYLFGARTGLETYFGHPLRAIFDDSYEFKADRDYTWNFLPYFKRKRGYDISKWLGANMQLGYNNQYARAAHPDAPVDFVFSDEDWRLRYDYDLTLSDLLGENFLDATRHWTESRGLLHRTQTYGFNMDMIGSAGLASIPETETMMQGMGSEGSMKLITSGAHLYNKPVTSAESAVFINRAFMTTPQKLRMVVDKLMAVGVNQVIFHGTSYHYKPEGYGKEGWYPWSSNMITSINFSSNINESDPFWKYQSSINQYITRTQYALRAGRPHADVLIYYPFLNFDDNAVNPEEILTAGYLKGIEPPLPAKPMGLTNMDDQKKWYERTWKIINKLEASGVSWEWVNDASLQQAKLNSHQQIDIRGNLYQAVILSDVPYIQLNTARMLSKLSGRGMKLLMIGEQPKKQPGFLDYQVNDKLTADLIKTSITNPNAKQLKDADNLLPWINGLDLKVKYTSDFGFVRSSQREMEDGSRIQFIWNKSDSWKKITIQLDKGFKNSYWLNAEDGSMVRNTGQQISYTLPPYSSRILYASTGKIVPANLLSTPKAPLLANRKLISLDKWEVKADSISVKNAALFDWRDNPAFKFLGSDGTYTTSFNLKKQTGKRYYLDLGKVYFTAEVSINRKMGGTLLYAPYILDITSMVKSGKNILEIKLTTGQLNYFIGRAHNGDKLYKQFKGQEDKLMAAGIVGPAAIQVADN
ncbi:glycosyl hydrolase [Mucilaginibacter sp. cycad4]|uniref:glycosyl hydrolase n=1 Tax=Mucilaginibacter sp. cycad4 TaxID=3342096 RepID=UPI002AAB3B2E|nr:glycosyl hydrolase [Mucilaginibacter gossypii]WPV01970.1 glycosyl hydrolase [Mucilaginibacter gossypii]